MAPKVDTLYVPPNPQRHPLVPLESWELAAFVYQSISPQVSPFQDTFGFEIEPDTTLYEEAFDIFGDHKQAVIKQITSRVTVSGRLSST